MATTLIRKAYMSFLLRFASVSYPPFARNSFPELVMEYPPPTFGQMNPECTKYLMFLYTYFSEYVILCISRHSKISPSGLAARRSISSICNAHFISLPYKRLSNFFIPQKYKINSCYGY